MGSPEVEKREGAIEIELDGAFFSIDAILKTCYWYSKQFAFDVRTLPGNKTTVTLQAKDKRLQLDSLVSDFRASVADFTLRERIESKTAAIRETLLAKAFAESGILEDAPEGLPLDSVEQERKDGLFNILSNS